MKSMHKLKTGALVAIIGVSGVMAASMPGLASAATGTWSRDYTGPHGYTHQIDGSCASGSGCTRTKVNTAPGGYTWTRYGTAEGNGAGDINRSVTFTGQGGSSASFSWVR
ncbi:hypothetical protein C4568_00560 [Candidatus Parcubacteria bacterium]|nr:MAG: hypothetical protein C4568_00560 [Candidatus Parcubacteria bacterium]